MFTPFIGILILTGVMWFAFTDRAIDAKLSFFDAHAAIVVFGGMLGALFLAIDYRSLGRMGLSLVGLLPKGKSFNSEIIRAQEALETMSNAWRSGNRTRIVEIAESQTSEEIRISADALLRRLDGSLLHEQFVRLRTDYLQKQSSVIEGWEMVSRLAPSFGMVGTVTGMVMLFKNMGENSGNLGGAMAMALLATLYGISLGAALGGPLASKVNKELNEKLILFERMEKTIAALVDEDRQRETVRA